MQLTRRIRSNRCCLSIVLLNSTVSILLTHVERLGVSPRCLTRTGLTSTKVPGRFLHALSGRKTCALGLLRSDPVFCCFLILSETDGQFFKTTQDFNWSLRLQGPMPYPSGTEPGHRARPSSQCGPAKASLASVFWGGLGLSSAPLGAFWRCLLGHVGRSWGPWVVLGCSNFNKIQRLRGAFFPTKANSTNPHVKGERGESVHSWAPKKPKKQFENMF